MTRQVASLVILYVSDPGAAAAFWRALLEREPDLDVPGMTEFALPGCLKLGLMPEAGIRRLLPALPAFPGPSFADPPAPRAELYLVVDSPDAWLARALACGALPLDPVLLRDWGDRVGYALDPWGHVLAFAASTE
jgi:uncharacterized protein